MYLAHSACRSVAVHLRISVSIYLSIGRHTYWLPLPIFGGYIVPTSMSDKRNKSGTHIGIRRIRLARGLKYGRLVKSSVNVSRSHILQTALLWAVDANNIRWPLAGSVVSSS